MENKTLWAVLKKRMLDFIANNPISRTVGILWKTILGVTLFLFFIDRPEDRGEHLTKLLTLYDGIIPRFFLAILGSYLSILIIFNLRKWYHGILGVFGSGTAGEGGYWEDLADVLKAGRFERGEVVGKGFSREEHKVLQKVFEETGILVRIKKNNSLILSPDWKSEDIDRLFKECDSIADIREFCKHGRVEKLTNGEYIKEQE